jgi:hypothetical protein
MPIADAARHLAPVCLAITEQHRQTFGTLKSHLKVSLKWLVRDLERYVHPKVSAAALEKAHEMGIKNLRMMQYRDQPHRMKDVGRKIFHWEHVTRVADLSDAILTMPEPTCQEIEEIIRGTVVAWILKKEDERLPPGPRANPFAIYKAAGIDLLD